MTAIVDLTPMILPFVRDCSVAAATVAARFAAIEFYKQTLWQQEMLEPVDLIEGQSIYELEVPPDTIPALIMRIEIDGRANPLTFKAKDELDQLFGSDWTTRLGTPIYATQISPLDVVLVPGPDAGSAGPRKMRLLVAVQPLLDAQEIDDTVFHYYGEAISYGARARLYETAGQPYYDPQSAPFCWNRFYGGVYEAKAKRMKDHTRATQHIQLRKWV